MATLDQAPEDSYQKPYNIRRAIRGVNSFEVTFPPEVIEREARKRGISVDQFLKTFQAVAQYDSFDGVFYKFEPRKD